MKKFLITVLSILCCLFFSLGLVACNTENSNNNSSNQNEFGCTNDDNNNNDTNSKLVGTEASFAGFTKVDDTTYTIKVSNTKEIYIFSEVVKVSEDSSWKLTADIYGIVDIPSKIGTLEVGDNTYYCMVTDSKDNVKMYTLQVRRKPLYMLSFETNGGGLVSSIQVEEDSSALNISSPTKENYDFAGWFTNSNLTNEYNNFPITKTTTLYAKYTTKNFEISYFLDGGTNNIDNIANYNYESETFILKEPTKSGYDFDGWYSDSSLTQSITSIPQYSSGSKAIYAKWKRIYIVEHNSIVGLTTYGSTLSNLVIPETIDGVEITTIVVSVSTKYTNVVSIILSNNITCIDREIKLGFPNLNFNKYGDCDYLGTQDNDYYALIDNNINSNAQESDFTINNNTVLLAFNSIGVNINTSETLIIPASVKYISRAIRGGYSGAGAFLTYDNIIFEDETKWFASKTPEGEYCDVSSIVGDSALSADYLQWAVFWGNDEGFYYGYWKKN